MTGAKTSGAVLPTGQIDRAEYVPALDGVRALAVAGVLAFHGGVSQLRGGFLGVDAFFVLSGYLITTLLLVERQRTGRIDLAAFWGRRARRLLPALLLVIAVIAVAAPRFLPREEVRLLRGDGLAALFYVANWRMIDRGGDYFAQTAAPSPLQHTWSLGIEEQFYLLWPLVLAGLLWHGWRVRAVALVCAAGAAVSAVWLALVYRGADPTRAYYATDTRASSLLIGATLAAVLVARAPRGPLTGRPRRLVLAIAGMGVVYLAWAWTHLAGDDAWLYRGALALSAVSVAAVLASVVLVPDGLPARVLGLAPLAALGRISYGVYLWHWPVFIAANADRTGQHGVALLALRCLITLVIAILSYVLLERPIRSSFSLATHRWRGVTATATAVAVAVATVIVATSVPSVPTGNAGQSPVAGVQGVDGLDAIDQGGRSVVSPPPGKGAPTARPSSRHDRRPGEPVVVDVFGDSVAWSLVTYLPSRPGLDVRDRTSLGCGVSSTAPYRYFGQTYPTLLKKCRNWPARWGKAVRRDNPDVAFILVGRWETMDRMLNGRWTHIGDPAFDEHLRSQLETAIAVAGSRGARVVLGTEPYNRRGEQPDGSLYPEDHPQRVTDWNRLLRQVAAATPNVRVVDFGRRVSPEGRFSWTAGGVQVRADGLHLTPSGVQQWVAPWLLPKLRSAARG